MQLIIAKTAGFCFGVNRAVKLAYDTINSNNNGKVYCLGPIIHNELVVSDLEKKGVKVVYSPQDVEEHGIVIIESHGVGEKQILELKNKHISIVDATCPYVGKIHSIVKQHYEDGYSIIIVGNPNHPEVIGINGWCLNNAIIVNTFEQVKSISDIGNKVCVVSQTTNELDKWEQIKDEIIEKYPRAVVFDTICRATYERQKEARDIAEKVSAMVIIGSRSSSNTRNLFSICSKVCSRTFHIESPDELNCDNFSGCEIIGVTAGASAPGWLINEVLNKLTETCVSAND